MTQPEDRSVAAGRLGAYSLQAAIAAAHARAKGPADTDWRHIVSLYNVLLRVDASPVVALIRAVAVAEPGGQVAGLEVLEPIMGAGYRADYPLARSVRADFLRRVRRVVESRNEYRSAFYLTRQQPQRKFVLRRLAELDASPRTED